MGVLEQYGCRRIIQVDAAHCWWMRRFPPLLCKALWVPRKALYKCNELIKLKGRVWSNFTPHKVHENYCGTILALLVIRRYFIKTIPYLCIFVFLRVSASDPSSSGYYTHILYKHLKGTSSYWISHLLISIITLINRNELSTEGNPPIRADSHQIITYQKTHTAEAHRKPPS